MNYSWNWGVLFEQTGIGNELYIHWMITGLGWLLLIGSIAWAWHCFDAEPIPSDHDVYLGGGSGASRGQSS